MSMHFESNLNDSSSSMTDDAEDPVSAPLLPNVSRSIDQLTLELLTNKTQYEKYLSKSEPQKWSEKQGFLVNCRKYSAQIIKITAQYLKNPDLQLNNDANNAFMNYAQSLIRHFEIKELGAMVDEDSDEDVLFPENCIDFSESHANDELLEDLSCDNATITEKKRPVSRKMDYLHRDFFRLSKNKHL